MTMSTNLLYEYACHEGNYAMEGSPRRGARPGAGRRTRARRRNPGRPTKRGAQELVATSPCSTPVDSDWPYRRARRVWRRGTPTRCPVSSAAAGPARPTPWALAQSAPCPRRLDYNVDMAWQTGHRADDDIKAWAGHYALGWMVGNSASKPRVAIEYNHASGDDDPVGRPHKHVRSAVSDESLRIRHRGSSRLAEHARRGRRIGMLPASSVRLDVAVHRFILGTVADGLYSAGGGGTIWKPHAMSHGRPGSTLEERHRRRPGWPGLGNLCRQAKMPQDALDDRRVVDEGDKAKAPRYTWDTQAHPARACAASAPPRDDSISADGSRWHPRRCGRPRRRAPLHARTGSHASARRHGRRGRRGTESG